MADEREIWMPIPGAPEHEASSLGRIRHCKVLKPFDSGKGYFFIRLWWGKGKAKFASVNALVCGAFHGPKPTPQHQAAHGDGVRSNNAPGNLRWATPKENTWDKFAHGTMLRGERNGMAKLSDAQVREIRAKREAEVAAGRKHGAIGRIACEFGVSVHTIESILYGINRRDPGEGPRRRLDPWVIDMVRHTYSQSLDKPWVARHLAAGLNVPTGTIYTIMGEAA